MDSAKTKPRIINQEEYLPKRKRIVEELYYRDPKGD
jgi:hypothetical protein